MGNMNETQYFDAQTNTETNVQHVLKSVCEAMIEKGYNPQNQITGFIMSGDPTYITSHNGARKLIMKVERDEIIDELIRFYLEYKVNVDK